MFKAAFFLRKKQLQLGALKTNLFIMRFIILLLVILIIPGAINCQQVSNIHFEQVGKQIHIYYDLKGDGEFNISVFCSIDNGHNWGKPLQYVTGDVGKKQKAGFKKEILWDVLKELDNLVGNLKLKIKATGSEFNGIAGNFIDRRDGRMYRWIRVGDQIWMAENLIYKSPDYSWAKEVYGYLYSWSEAKKVCPDGWHLPTDEEWKIIEGEIDSKYVKGDPIWDRVNKRGYDIGTKLKLKEGFNALPSGGILVYDAYYFGGDHYFFWSADEASSSGAWCRNTWKGGSSDKKLSRNNMKKKYKMSVRCLKN